MKQHPEIDKEYKLILGEAVRVRLIVKDLSNKDCVVFNFGGENYVVSIEEFWRLVEEEKC